ncbi:MAG: hypothetical protein KGJ59_15325, partial [Bacteroidota bacterium]|nr:hypothetical protein [Bacteroidota bacterium]
MSVLRRRTRTSCFFFIIFNFIVLQPVHSDTQEAQPPETSTAADGGHERIFVAGEELTYEVSYSIFTLGTVKIQVLDQTVKNGKIVYRAKALIDSHTKIPFVNLHYVFYSENDTDFYSHYFSGM